MIRIADIGVVPAEVIALAIVGDLYKAADVVRPRPGQEQRCCLGKLEIVVLGGWLGRFYCRERSIEDYRKRKCLKEVQRRIVVFLVICYLRLGGECVAFQLEGSAKWCEFGRSIVARSAWHSRLPRVAGHGSCAGHRENNERYHRKKLRKDSG